jgi:predicted lipoprotein with Yx(FWY)xxD motif
VGVRLLLRVIGAGLLIAIAAIHLDLYLTGYNTIATIGPLFLFQVIVAFALGGLMLVTGNRLVAAAGAGFALATLGGYLLTVQFGLFGFREVRTTAGIVAGILEVVAFAVLAYLAATPAAVASAPGSSASSAEAAAAAAARRGGVGGTSDAAPGGVHAAAGPGSGWADRLPDWLTAGVSPVLAVLGAAAVSVVALGLLGGALAGAPGSSGSTGPTSASGAALKSTSIGGMTVLVNSTGRTLYWFAPDTSGKSACYGGCAAYWPPVAGPLKAGAGVTGTLATIKRTDGSVQETYNGHPLYTYIGDSGPGQDHGNNLNLNGGLWHIVPVSG